MNTIVFTIQWAGCPKGCLCLFIVTAAKMAILKQDLFPKNKIIKIQASLPLPIKYPEEQTTKAHTEPADCRQLFQLSTESVTAPAQRPAAVSPAAIYPQISP